MLILNVLLFHKTEMHCEVCTQVAIIGCIPIVKHNIDSWDLADIQGQYIR